MSVALGICGSSLVLWVSYRSGSGRRCANLLLFSLGEYLCCSSCESYWTVFADPQGVIYNPCNDKAIWDDTKAFDGNEIKYPVSEGPFNGGGLTGCVYSQLSSTDVGSMACGGVVGTCVKDTSGRQSCDGRDDTWAPVSICTFT